VKRCLKKSRCPKSTERDDVRGCVGNNTERIEKWSKVYKKECSEVGQKGPM
jgi:hypothetical protein